MRIKTFTVRNLFGSFTHVIDMNLDKNITIMYGLNGFGKSTILQMIDAFFQGKYSTLLNIPFDELFFEFDDTSLLELERTNKGHSFRVNYLDYDPEILRMNERDFRVPLSMIDEIIPELTRVGSREWLTPDGELLEKNEVFYNYADRFPTGMIDFVEPKWLKNLRDSVNTRFVKTQRLSIDEPESEIHTVREYDIISSRRLRTLKKPSVQIYSDELADTIASKLNEYASLSQKLDATFPNRLVEQLKSDQVPQLEIGELMKELEELREKRQRLMRAGLLDKEMDDVEVDEQIDTQLQNVLSIYVKDIREKLQVFTQLLDKIELFMDIINRRFENRKIMTIDKQNGIQFMVEGTEKLLSPDKLSSGEQHQIVLFYELLFKVEERTLILIDEPELSLHILWQELFLNDIETIAQKINLDVLLATHSPQLINDKWDWTVELTETK